MAKKFYIGIDPGFTETGIVIRQGRKLRHAVLTCKPNGSSFHRTMALSAEILDEIMTLLDEMKANTAMDEVHIGLEMPIWHKKKSNPRSFELQWRLVQQIESDISIEAVAYNTITEVLPTQSKVLATKDGGADKLKVAEASPFLRENFAKDSHWYTVGDAWAHSLATPGKGMHTIDLASDDYPEVKHEV